MSPSGPRILLVSSDSVAKEFLADSIQSEGWRCDVADTVEEALAAASDLEPDVIVLDPRADDGRAIELLVSLRRAVVWTPVLLWTDEPEFDEGYALEHGATGIVPAGDGFTPLRDAISSALADEETDRPL